MSNLRVLEVIRRNISAILSAQQASQTSLAFALGKDKSWINKFINGHRSIQLRDLDQIAGFFGLDTYRLLQPGIAATTERRSGTERRTGTERRIGHQQRKLESIVGIVASLRPGAPHGARRAVSSGGEPSAKIGLAALRDLKKEIDALVAAESAAESRRQAVSARKAITASRPRHRATRRSAALKDKPA